MAGGALEFLNNCPKKRYAKHHDPLAGLTPPTRTPPSGQVPQFHSPSLPNEKHDQQSCKTHPLALIPYLEQAGIGKETAPRTARRHSRARPAQLAGSPASNASISSRSLQRGPGGFVRRKGDWICDNPSGLCTILMCQTGEIDDLLFLNQPLWGSLFKT